MALVARNIDTGIVIADRVAVAATRQTRRTGLLHHTSLPEGEGLWIVPSRGVHTFGMKFAIDVLALDEAGRVIDLVADMKPRRIRLPRKGTAGVLELPAGWLAKTGTTLGHRIQFSVAPAVRRGVEEAA